MTFRFLITLLVCFVLFIDSYAQTESVSITNKNTPDEQKFSSTSVQNRINPSPVITEDCKINIEIFQKFANNKQYVDALSPWLSVYKDCPSATKIIYSRGKDILQWRLNHANDVVIYNETFEQLMTLYDNRIKYFGNDVRYPSAWILGIKALDYIAYSKQDSLKEKAYRWLEQSIDDLKTNAEPEFIRQFLVLSSEIYKVDKSHIEKYFSDYLKTNNLLERKSTVLDTVKAKNNILLKNKLDVLFVKSIDSNCETLDSLFKNKITDNYSNKEYLSSIINLYKICSCTNSEVYFMAFEATFKIAPTEITANICAEISYKRKDFSKSISYYQEATKLAENTIKKADYQYKIAQIYYGELNNFLVARDFARNSLVYNPNCGSSYILIGIMYAKSTGVFDDSVVTKSVFWLAVDNFIKAKQIDKKSVVDADELIKTYSKYFPTKEEIFFRNDMKIGKPYFVGGWIKENTMCR